MIRNIKDKTINAVLKVERERLKASENLEHIKEKRFSKELQYYFISKIIYIIAGMIVLGFLVFTKNKSLLIKLGTYIAMAFGGWGYANRRKSQK